MRGENNVALACFIYLTDLGCDSFTEAPEYPVLWVTDSRKMAPFGDTLRIRLERSHALSTSPGAILPSHWLPSFAPRLCSDRLLDFFHGSTFVRTV